MKETTKNTLLAWGILGTVSIAVLILGILTSTPKSNKLSEEEVETRCSIVVEDAWLKLEDININYDLMYSSAVDESLTSIYLFVEGEREASKKSAQEAYLVIEQYINDVQEEFRKIENDLEELKSIL